MDNFIKCITGILAKVDQLIASMDKLAAAMGAKPADPSTPPATKPGRPKKDKPADTAPVAGSAPTIPAVVAGSAPASGPAADNLDDMFAEGPAVAGVEPTQDEVRAKLNTVIATKGKEIAKKIVVEIGNAQSFSLLQPAKFAAVVAACDAALKG
jgi:hypothetical protein